MLKYIFRQQYCSLLNDKTPQEGRKQPRNAYLEKINIFQIILYGQTKKKISYI